MQVLEARKRVLGAEHQDTLWSMHNLAVIYHAKACYKEAEALYMQVLKARKRVLGAEHRDTLLSMHNLAALWGYQDRLNEAIALMESALELRTNTHGADDIDTRESAKWLNALQELLVGEIERGEREKEDVDLEMQSVD